ncbi:hypothetical protein [Larkinella sp. GY13]|uniref:hypothetical protein n=1 Tax=Larkinella sp. GY13 TaxID=3453720 RepID=UPI003F70C952
MIHPYGIVGFLRGMDFYNMGHPSGICLARGLPFWAGWNPLLRNGHPYGIRFCLIRQVWNHRYNKIHGCEMIKFKNPGGMTHVVAPGSNRG